MFLTFKYKLKPSRAQYLALDRILESQRLLYNAALQERCEAWRKAGVSISKIDQSKSLTQIRAEDEFYRAMPVALSRWSLAKVDEAMRGFFGRVRRGAKPGFPRFRAIGRWSSFGFTEWSGIRLKADRLLFAPLVGGLRVHMHRPLPEGAPIKTCTFTRSGRHWWVALVVDVPAAEAHDQPEASIGLDVGVKHLAVTSAGEFIPNARPLARHRKQLRRAARALARCKRGSKGRAKRRARLAAIQKRIANCRSTYLHQVAADLTKRYALIGVEDLKLRNMTRSARGTAEAPGTNVRQKAGLNRELQDAAPGRLVELLIYKAVRAGGLVIKVDPRGTSQDCSVCGTTVAKSLSERTHRCGCGAVLDRDLNAAVNIRNRALAAHERAMPLDRRAA